MKTRFYHLRKPNPFASHKVRNEYQSDVTEHIQRAFILGQIRKHTTGLLTHQLINAEAVTICVLEDDAGKELFRGYAFCGYGEQFSRAKGRSIAQGRALTQAARELG